MRERGDGTASLKSLRQRRRTIKRKRRKEKGWRGGKEKDALLQNT